MEIRQDRHDLVLRDSERETADTTELTLLVVHTVSQAWGIKASFSSFDVLGSGVVMNAV